MTDELPPGWAVVKLEEVVIVNPPGSSTTVPDDQRVTFLPMSAVEPLTGRFDASATRTFGDVKKGFTRFKDEDLLFAKITPCMENGKIAVVRGLHNGIGCGSTEFHVLRAQQGIAPDYVRHFVSRSVFRKDAERNMRGAVGQKRVPPEYLREAQIPIAPTAEQERIVSKIDELFSRIDEGERALERVSVLVERYRQSVLKAAVTGELTRAWREKNKETLESGEALLARILTARREAWEKAELEKMKAKGSAPTAEKWKQNNAKIAQPATFGLPKFPAGWQTVRLATIAEVVDPQPSHRTPPVDPDGVPYLGIGDIRDGRVNSERARKVSRDVLAEHRMRYSLSRGDFIFGKIGTIGQPVSLVEPFEYTLSANVVLVQPRADGVNSSFVRYWMASNYVDHLVRGSQRATAQPALGIQKARDLACPLPPTPEQDEIVSRVDNLESVADGLIDLVQAAASRSIALRQAVLSAAFAGRLVAQCDSDEPASILLQRIATERASDTAAPKRGRKKKITA